LAFKNEEKKLNNNAQETPLHRQRGKPQDPGINTMKPFFLCHLTPKYKLERWSQGSVYSLT
jgi:hypothetical protein